MNQNIYVTGLFSVMLLILVSGSVNALTITNSTWNMTSDGGNTNWTTNQSFPVITTDGTPTTTFSTNEASTCSMSKTSQATYNSSEECSTVNGLSHTCTLNYNNILNYGIQNIYGACVGTTSFLYTDNAHGKTMSADATSVTYKIGDKFIANNTVTVANASKNNGATDTNWYLYDSACTSLLTSGSFSANVAVINYNVTAGTTYCLLADKGGVSREFGPKYDGASLAVNGDINWTARVWSTSSDANGELKWMNITTLKITSGSGSVTSGALNINMTAGNGGVCAITQKTCSFTAGSISLSGMSGCI